MPAPATARGLPAPVSIPAGPAPGTVSLKPLAPELAAPRSGQVPVALPVPPEAAPAEEVPFDLDMSGAILPKPPAPTRKPGR